jgi:hypothetical protein
MPRPGQAVLSPLAARVVARVTSFDNLSATATFNVKPRIDSISPAFGVPGSVVHATINGAGFDSNSKVQVAGTGITVNVTNRQAKLDQRRLYDCFECYNSERQCNGHDGHQGQCRQYFCSTHTGSS